MSENPDLLGDIIEPDWPQVHEDVLRFYLVEELGRGGMGRVYLAEQPELADRRVVVKLSAFGNQEADMLGRLQHPNVVAVHSFEEDEERRIHAICMPYLGRTTLDDLLDIAFESGHPPRKFATALDGLLDRHPTDDRELFAEVPDRSLRRLSYVDGIITVTASIADALEHTHDRSVYHLDLKPSNVLLSPTGHPTLLDFNLSRNTIDENRLIGGTLPYMAPEQVRTTVFHATTEDARIDQRCDIYSTGLLLYQLLTGEHPFGPISWNRPREDVANELLTYQQQGPNTSALRAIGLDAASAKVIERCLAFDPGQRYQSAGDLAADLRRCVTRRRRFRRWRAAHPRVIASVVLCMVLVLAGVSYGIATRPSLDQRLLAVARASLDAGNFEEALIDVNGALEANDRSAEIWFLRGQIHKAQDKFPDACEDYSRAIEIEPSSKHHVALGYSYLKLVPRQYANAEKHLLIACKEGYKSPEVYNLLGRIAHRKKAFDVADEWYEKAVELDPDFAPGWYNRAENKIRANEKEELIASVELLEDVKLAVKTSDRAPNVLYFAAYCYFESDETSPSRVPTILKYLREAVAAGHPKPKVRKWLDIDEFKNDPRIRGVFNVPVNAKQPLQTLPDPLPH